MSVENPAGDGMFGEISGPPAHSGSAGRLFFHARERDFTSIKIQYFTYSTSMPLYSVTLHARAWPAPVCLLQLQLPQTPITHSTSSPAHHNVLTRHLAVGLGRYVFQGMLTYSPGPGSVTCTTGRHARHSGSSRLMWGIVGCSQTTQSFLERHCTLEYKKRRCNIKCQADKKLRPCFCLFARQATALKQLLRLHTSTQIGPTTSPETAQGAACPAVREQRNRQPERPRGLAERRHAALHRLGVASLVTAANSRAAPTPALSA